MAASNSCFAKYIGHSSSRWNLERVFYMENNMLYVCIQIKTAAGNITRPVVKVSVLPHNGDISCIARITLHC